MSRLALTICLAALVSGCVAPKRIRLPDGNQGYAITCNGSARTWNWCYEQAGKACGAAGYDVLTQDGEQSPNGVATQYGAMIGSNVTRSMLIRCKN